MGSTFLKGLTSCAFVILRSFLRNAISKASFESIYFNRYNGGETESSVRLGLRVHPLNVRRQVPLQAEGVVAYATRKGLLPVVGEHVCHQVGHGEKDLFAHLTPRLVLLRLVHLLVIGHVGHPHPTDWAHLPGLVNLSQVRLHRTRQFFRVLTLDAHQHLSRLVLVEEVVQQPLPGLPGLVAGRAVPVGLKEYSRLVAYLGESQFSSHLPPPPPAHAQRRRGS